MATNPARTNLNAWWAFNETSGDRADSHGSFTLTDNNTVGYGTGKQGNAANLAASASEHFTRNDEAGLSFTGDWTLSGWIKPTIDSATHRVVTKYQTSPITDREFLIQIGSDNKIIIAVYKSDGTGVSAKWGTALSNATWYHVFAYCDHANDVIGISINGGTPVTTSWTATVNNGGARLLFGSYDGASTGYFDGLLDEWCWYGRVLSTDERDWLYNSGSGRTYSETLVSTSVTPDAVAATPTANAPSLTLGGTSVTPSAAAPAPTANAPSLTLGGVSLTPDAAAPSATANAPSLTLGAVSLTPSAADAAPTANAPSLTLGAVSVTPSAATGTATALAPSLTLGAVSLTPAAAALTVTALAPSVTPGAVVVTVDAANASPTALAPVLALGAIVVLVGPVDALAAALDPSGEPGEVVLTPDAAGITLVALDPSTFTDLVPDALELVLVALAPSLVLGEAVIVADVADVTLTANDPTVVPGAVTITPSAAALTLVALAPSGELAQTVNLLLARTRQAAALIDPRPRHPAIALSTWLALPTYPTGQVAVASIPWTVPVIGPAALVAARPEPARSGLAQPDPGVLPSPAAAAAVESRAGQPAAAAAEIDWE